MNPKLNLALPSAASTPSSTFIASTDAGKLRDYRTEIPNLIDDAKLSVYAFRLYVHLKRVTGEHGKCWQSTHTLASICKMSAGRISKAKKELETEGLIQIQKVKDRTGWHDEITVVDLWRKNYATYAPTLKLVEIERIEQPEPSPTPQSPTEESVPDPMGGGSPNKQGRSSSDEAGCSLGETPGCSSGEPKKEPMNRKKNKPPEEHQRDAARRAQGAPAPARGPKDKSKDAAAHPSTPSETQAAINELLAFLADVIGPISNEVAQQKAARWIITNGFTIVEAETCLREQLADTWRHSAVSWLTVRNDISTWRTRRRAAMSKSQEQSHQTSDCEMCNGEMNYVTEINGIRQVVVCRPCWDAAEDRKVAA